MNFNPSKISKFIDIMSRIYSVLRGFCRFGGVPRFFDSVISGVVPDFRDRMIATPDSIPECDRLAINRLLCPYSISGTRPVYNRKKTVRIPCDILNF